MLEMIIEGFGKYEEVILVDEAKIIQPL